MKGFHIALAIFFSSIISNAYSQLPSASAIATSNPIATQAGIKILEEGGNAFDAAVTVASVLAVVEPYTSGLGGGGFWLLRDNRNSSKSKDIIIDARERAPLAANKDMFLVNGQASALLSQQGALSAAIPGEPAGFAYLARHYGKLPLSRTLAPAIKLAEEGFALDPVLIKELQENQQKLSAFSVTRDLFFKDGKVLPEGSVLVQPALANVLKQLAALGHDGFYQGREAAQLVNGLKKEGGIWTLEDLKNYKVNILEPLTGKYHKLNIITTPLPSAGGIGLLTGLNILSDYELEGLSEADHKHLIIESLRRVYCDRAHYLGDPEFVDIKVKDLISPKNASQWRKSIKINTATKSDELACGLNSKESEHTTQYVILDQEGNAVSATLSLNRWFGSSLIPEGTGVILNNTMDDFSSQTGGANGYGLIGAQLNSIAPNKRPLSSMMPTFFETAAGMGILGTPGGSRIPSMMLLAILTAEKDNLPFTWVLTPRFHHQYMPDIVYFEPEALTIPMQNALKNRGHMLEQTKEPYGNMQAIFWDKKNNKVYAASDPRRTGLAVVKKFHSKNI